MFGHLPIFSGEVPTGTIGDVVHDHQRYKVTHAASATFRWRTSPQRYVRQHTAVSPDVEPFGLMRHIPHKRVEIHGDAALVLDEHGVIFGLTNTVQPSH